MQTKTLAVRRQNTYLFPEKSRVLLRPFIPAQRDRIRSLLDRVASLGEQEVDRLIIKVMEEFRNRHVGVESILEARFGQVLEHIPAGPVPSRNRRLLIGAYCSCEYSLEAAALFNPSIVAHPDQTGVDEGSLRFILSLRATGEGHISSIEFRTGVIGPEGDVTIDPSSSYVTAAQPAPDPTYEKADIRLKLRDVGCLNACTNEILKPLPASFPRSRLEKRIELYRRRRSRLGESQKNSLATLRRLMESNYEIRFDDGRPLNERAIFPISADERNGIEDARFVRFTSDDGTVSYYATYTAYDGHAILPKFLETQDFVRFRIRTLNGKAIQDKGMAFFPRKLRGKYVMVSRQDGENLFIMMSDNLYDWNEKRLLLQPTAPWEYIQIGNCGSPVETDEGWVLLTHGVGPMRTYCLGAILLDKDDPSKVIGQLKQPLLEPTEDEREGYVPNVVYTCGALLHNGTLVIPYAMSDYATSFASVPVHSLIASIK